MNESNDISVQLSISIYLSICIYANLLVCLSNDISALSFYLSLCLSIKVYVCEDYILFLTVYVSLST